jgi:hypothetical protein
MPTRARVRLPLSTGGTSGNQALTTVTGTLLVALLAVIGLTLLRLRTLLWVHLFVGLLLIGPVMLKLASTGYRFMRYYTHNAAYRVKGPPPAILRGLAPLVVLSTVIVFASGVALLFTGPSDRGTLQPIHKISFIAWIALTGLHVLGHLPEIPNVLRREYARAGIERLPTPGREGRALALTGALVGGLVLALLLIPEFSSWMHWNSVLHGHGDH